MTTYRIEAPHFCAAVIGNGGTVVQSAPVLRWSVGRPVTQVLDYCRQRGWTIVPLPAHNAPVTIEHGGDLYEFHQSDGRTTRITLHEADEMPRDVRYDELPDAVKRLL